MADESSVVAVFFTNLSEDVYRRWRSVVLQTELVFLRSLSLEGLGEAIAVSGASGVAIFFIRFLSDLFDIFASVPGALVAAVQTASVSALAGLVLDDPKDSTVVLTRKKAIEGLKRLLTTEAAALKGLSQTSQWRFVQLIRKLMGGVEKWLRVPGWASFVEKVIVVGIDFWVHLFNAAITFVCCLLLLHCANREVLENLFPTFSQDNPRAPAKRKVWTRERSNQR